MEETKKQNKFKKRQFTVVASLAAGLALLGLLGTGTAIAATTQSDNSEYSSIIQNLSEKFGLSEADIQTVFDETRQEQREAGLDKAVEAGTITEEQKQLILDKEDEIQTQIDEINSEKLTADERQTAMRDIMEETRTWADENDIPMMLLHGGMMGRGEEMGPRGFGPGEPMGM